MYTWFRLCSVLVLVASPSALRAQNDLFADKVAPLLAHRCLECHNASTKKGRLDLSQKATAFAGGKSGPALVPDNLDKSLLYDYVVHDEMPKGRDPLAAAEKAILKQWVLEGANWSTAKIDPFAYTSEHRAGYDWWALQPISHANPPRVQRADWCVNEIDHFVLAKLEERGLQPAARADRRTLLRRVSFDLIGLPPTPEEMKTFLEDTSPRAYEKVVDRLLASPHFGERWGRHWLDVVRFGESQGFERNRIRDNAWRYRDWVIDAFNADLPYDEFIRRQIAGDVLYPGDLDALLATGYHVCGTWDQVAHKEGSGDMKKAARQDELEDLVATLGQAFLGMTINCARCHDHKFDPISQKEYYQFTALLGGVTQQEKERSDLTKFIKGKNVPKSAHVLVPSQPPNYHVLERGDFRKPGEEVAPRALERLVGLSGNLGLKPNAPEAERRAKLAEWLTNPKNPLPARVIVNRLWHYHFGSGIVPSPSDFGFNGGVPSHPELLDWLVSTLIREGWKLKAMHRRIVLSATYQQQSRATNAKAETIDADNRLLWRANMRRLEAEAVRDAALAVSGALVRQRGGPSFRDVAVKLDNNHTFTDPTNEFSDRVNRRTIYRLWARSGNNPMLEALDCPDPTVMSPRRPVTLTPTQALSLLNSSFMENCARRLASRVEAASQSPREQVRLAFELALTRPPRDDEQTLCETFLAEHGLMQMCLVVLNTNEFLFLN